MKTKLTIIAMLVCLLGDVCAQGKKIRIGLKGGLSIASMSNWSGGAVSYGGNRSTYKNKPKSLPHLGAYAEFKVTDFFSFQPELLFSMKGGGAHAKVVAGPNSSETNKSRILSYIDIPLQMRFNFEKGFHILAGPYVGILLGSKSTTETEQINGSTTVNTKSTSTIKTDLKSTDVGMYVGVGYETEGGLSLGARWCKGFTDITKAASAGSFSVNPTNTNSVIQFSVGYKLAAF